MEYRQGGFNLSGRGHRGGGENILAQTYCRRIDKRLTKGHEWVIYVVRGRWTNMILEYVVCISF